MHTYGHLENTYNCVLLLRLTNQPLPLFLISTPNMSLKLEPDITHNLMALQAHEQIQPTLVPGNPVAVIGWNVIGVLFLVSHLLGFGPPGA